MALEVDNIIDNFKPPEKLYEHVLLIREGKSCTFLNISEWDEDVESIGDLNRDEQGAVVDRASHIISDYHQEEVRYRLKPLQNSYDLVHSNTKVGRVFKELNEKNWFHNSERFKILKGKKARIYPYSLTFIEDNRFVYDGKSIEAEINTNDVFDTLAKAGLFEESKSRQKLYRGSVYFDDNGESSVRSYWSRDEGCFYADSVRPSDRYSHGLAAFGKTNEKPEIKRVEIAKREYDDLLRQSEKLRKMEPIVKQLSSF